MRWPIDDGMEPLSKLLERSLHPISMAQREMRETKNEGLNQRMTELERNEQRTG